MKSENYLIDYDEGWEILAGDKRCQVVLARSEVGSLNRDTMPLSANDWLRDLLSMVSSGSTTLSEELNESEKRNIEFWNCISPAYVDGLYTESFQMRVSNGISGHWELVGVESDIVEEGVDHLIPVEWDQSYPYNLYCPLLGEAFGNYRCPAGCVAIAGAQLLYYFHFNLGTPITAPSSGSVSGYVIPNRNYVQSFFGESSSVWDTMLAQPVNAAPLIGKIGRDIETNYASQVWIGENYEVNEVLAGALTSDLAY